MQIKPKTNYNNADLIASIKYELQHIFSEQSNIMYESMYGKVFYWTGAFSYDIPAFEEHYMQKIQIYEPRINNPEVKAKNNDECVLHVTITGYLKEKAVVHFTHESKLLSIY